MWRLLLASFIKGALADHSAAQLPKEYFQTCTEDDKSVLPKYNLGDYAYIIVALVLMNAAATSVRTRFLKQKFQQIKISYCCLVICLYWELGISSLFAIILHHQQTHFQTLGRLSIVYPIINLIWTLYSVDKDNISILEKIASLLFQLFTVASLWIEIYFPFRIIFTSYSLLPLIQTIYWKYNRNAEKWDNLSIYQNINIMFYFLTFYFFPTVTMDPESLHYYTIQTVYGSLLNINLLTPAIPTMTGCMIKRYMLSLKRWLDKRNGRLLPNSQLCTICLQEMDAYAVVEEAYQILQIRFAWDSSLVRTSCGHTFHSACMKEWMDTYHWFCPMDYKKIPLKLQ